MEIRPATLDQIQKGRNGKKVVITNDVGDVAKKLKEVDPTLELHYNESAQYFVVIQRVGNIEHLVTTALDLDDRIVERIKKITKPEYNYEEESIAIKKQADKDLEHRRKEQVGEIGERLAHAIRKDLNEKKNF